MMVDGDGWWCCGAGGDGDLVDGDISDNDLADGVVLPIMVI